MTLPSAFPSLAATTLPPQPLHLAVGMFDGVHLGHRAVVAAAVQSARREGGRAAVLTFWPHPSALFRPEQPTRLLMDAATRADALLALGVDAVITEPFTPEFARITAEEFVSHLRSHLPQLAAIYAGENFRFGQGRRGDIALLVAEARRLGLAVFSAPRVNFNGEPISSTRLRAALAEGRLAEVNAMLGRTYTTTGMVQPGKQLGQMLGFPTLNVAWSPESRPRLGVYAVRVSGEKVAAPLPAVANYGLRPTVESAAITPVLEVHVLGACPVVTSSENCRSGFTPDTSGIKPDLHGSTAKCAAAEFPYGPGDAITVEWQHFLRPETKFASVDELRTQIARDCNAAADFFKL